MAAYSNLKGTRSPPARILPPSSPDVLALRRPASASWVLREAKQVAPTTRLAGRQSSKSRCVPPGSHSAPPASSSPLAFHHFEAGVEFVAALRTAHAVALDRGFINGNGHPAAVRTAPQLRGLNIQRLKLRTAETVHVLSVKLPGLPGVVDDGQGDVMVRGVVLQFLPGCESALDQLSGPRIIQSVPLHFYFGRSKLHGAPPALHTFLLRHVTDSRFVHRLGQVLPFLRGQERFQFETQPQDPGRAGHPLIALLVHHLHELLRP